MPASLEEQLVKHLTDVHSIEEQALVQVRQASRIAASAPLADAFRRHVPETREHGRLVRERLEAHSASTERLKDWAGWAGGVGMVGFALVHPETPRLLSAHAFSYEHMELAAHELLARIADRAGDPDTASVARRIAGEERGMAERLRASFDDVVSECLPRGDALGDRLVKHLTDAHAIEGQAIRLLERARKLAGDPEIARIYEEHLEETRTQQQRVRRRLEALGASPSRAKDTALSVG